MSSTLPLPSPFLVTPTTIEADGTCPAIVHLKRDHHVPLVVKSSTSPPSILQTRFGEFPHTSLIGLPYGSQVRARATPKVAANNASRKRKRVATDSSNPSTPAAEEGDEEESSAQGSGFIHILPPTAELWTASLPHRTQVVYTPDSSFILSKLGAKPGSVLIEAGAGSGSFTHASVRAVYSGYPDERELTAEERKEGKGVRTTKKGQVFSFEFHEERAGKLREELHDHGLEGLVTLTHRDVCKNGFLVPKKNENGEEEMVSPKAQHIFLDLPAPWLALPHLTRSMNAPTSEDDSSTTITPEAATAALAADPSATITATIPLQSLIDPTSSEPASLHINTTAPEEAKSETPSSPTPATPKPSALDPLSPVTICCFSPCMEQVTRTVQTLTKLGWTNIEMFEINHTRVEVRRQHQRGYEDGAGPRTLSEALTRLREVNNLRDARRDDQIATNLGIEKPADKTSLTGFKKQRIEKAAQGQNRKKIWGPDEGRLVTRNEGEIKSHTSYLTFAVLPREWTPEQEEEAKKAVEAVSEGRNKGTVGEKTRRWQKEENPDGMESKRARKKREREARREAEKNGQVVEDAQDQMDIDG